MLCVVYDACCVCCVCVCCACVLCVVCACLFMRVRHKRKFQHIQTITYICIMCTGLLDYETLWTSLLTNLSELHAPEELLLSFYVQNQYLDDMCKSLTQLCKFSDICISKLFKASCVWCVILSLMLYSFRQVVVCT